MNQLGGSKIKVTTSEKKDNTVDNDQPGTPFSTYPPFVRPHPIAKKSKKDVVIATLTNTNDADLPPPTKKTKVDKPELQARNVKTVSPYLVEIERLKGQHIAELKKLKEEYRAEVEKLKDRDQELKYSKQFGQVNEVYQAEIDNLKKENEGLKYTIETLKSEIRVQEHLVQVGAAVRGRWFELAKSSAGIGQPVTAIVEAGERAIIRANIRADLAMLQLGYASLPSVQAAQAATGHFDDDNMYKDGYFKELYTMSFSEFAEHLNQNFCSYPLKKLEICEMSGTMTSLAGYAPSHKYDEKSLLNKFQALMISADEEWAKHICHLWPDHQRRLNTANNWPPLDMIVRDMRSIVEEIADGVHVNTPATPKSSAAKKNPTDSPFFDSMSSSVTPKVSSSVSTGTVASASVSWNSTASNKTISGGAKNAALKST